MSEILRKALVSGQFYPTLADTIKKQIEGFLTDKKIEGKTDAIACMLPHAGFVYSGKVASLTVESITVKDKIIIIGPNHTGIGPTSSIMTEGKWETPLGQVEIDSALAKTILKNCAYLENDLSAHTHEHSIEVELPILQFFKNNFKFVPIVLFPQKINILQNIGHAIAKSLKELSLSDSTLIVASSDMTHYESQTQAKRKDQEALAAILQLDEEGLLRKVEDLSISMCGYGPVITMLSAAKELGAKKAKLIRYQTSGDVTKDNDSVVGYAGVIIY